MTPFIKEREKEKEGERDRERRREGERQRDERKRERERETLKHDSTCMHVTCHVLFYTTWRQTNKLIRKEV